MGNAAAAAVVSDLHYTNLVVHPHDRHEGSLGTGARVRRGDEQAGRAAGAPNRCLQLLHIHQPILLHGQIRDFPLLLLQVPARIQHALVFLRFK